MEKNFEQLEWCYLVEDTDPEATEVKIYIPKLMGNMSMDSKQQKATVNTTALKNSAPASDGNSGGNTQEATSSNVSGSVTKQNYIVAKMQDPLMHQHKHHNCPGNCPNTNHSNTCGSSSILSSCPHYHHDHHLPHEGEYGKVPAGAKMICLIMNKNLKDVIVTRLWCRW
jgi:hypothetical protein